MTTAIRAQVRQAAVAALNAAPALAGRVFVDQEYTVQPAQLPAVLVSVSEAATLDGTFGDIVERTITVSLRVLAKATSGLSNGLDAIGQEAEARLVEQGLMVGGKRHYPDTCNTAAPDLTAAGDQPIGEMVMEFQYYIPTRRDAPGQIA